MTDWKWSESANRYIDAETGRFISHSYVLGLIEQSLNQSIRVTDTLASYVSAGKINVQDWVGLMRSEIRDEYIRQYLAGIGGRSQMTQADWGTVGRALRDQYKFLEGFKNALPGLSEAQIRVRASMYIESAGEMYEKAHAKVAQNWGADQVSWILGATEHCELCLQWAGMGWRPIGPKGGFPTLDGEAFPRDGVSCYGKVRCGCMLAYQNSKTGQTFEGE